MTLAQYVKNDLEKSKLSVTELAEKINLSPKTIYNILNGEQIFPKTVRLIAKYYDLEIRKVADMLDYK